MDRPHYLEALERSNILPKLAAFDPHIVGTPPLGLDLPTSDIDVVCYAPDPVAFTRAVWEAFGARPKFHIWQKVPCDRPVVAKFAHAGWMIEIFGQSRPVADQHAQRHFVVEQQLLTLGGEPLRLAVMMQRGNGLKTEPAFAAVLGLDGDPYQALLGLECHSDMNLISLLRDKGFSSAA